tara:strand:- start:642 stop:752 length:111 start_codon:yes stop_codon:yes gene_type:complete
LDFDFTPEQGALRDDAELALRSVQAGSAGSAEAASL